MTGKARSVPAGNAGLGAPSTSKKSTVHSGPIGQAIVEDKLGISRLPSVSEQLAAMYGNPTGELQPTPPSGAVDPVETTVLPADPAIQGTVAQVGATPSAVSERNTYKPDRTLKMIESVLEMHGAMPLTDVLHGPALEAQLARRDFESKLESLLSLTGTDPRTTLDQVVSALTEYNMRLDAAAAAAAAGAVSTSPVPGNPQAVREARLSILKNRLMDKQAKIDEQQRERSSAALALKAIQMEMSRRDAEIEGFEAEAKKASDSRRTQLNVRIAESRGAMPDLRGRLTAAKERLVNAEGRLNGLMAEKNEAEGILLNEYPAPIFQPVIPDLPQGSFVNSPPQMFPSSIVPGILSQAPKMTEPEDPMGPVKKVGALAAVLGIGYAVLSGNGKKKEAPKPLSRKPVNIEDL